MATLLWTSSFLHKNHIGQSGVSQGPQYKYLDWLGKFEILVKLQQIRLIGLHEILGKFFIVQILNREYYSKEKKYTNIGVSVFSLLFTAKIFK